MNFSQIREYTTGLIKKAFSNKQYLDKIGESPSGNLMFGNTEINAAGTIINNTYNGKLSYAENYSTEEQIVGRWINGKPIYQVTIIKEVNIPNQQTEYKLEIDINEYIPNAEVITNSQAFGVWYYQEKNGYVYTPLNVAYSQYQSSGTYQIILSSNILYLSAIKFGYKTIQLTIQFTKTTDAENSFRPDMLEGASFSQTINYNNTLGYQDWLDTEERVVGRYIDGKPLYQKTIIYTFTGEEVSSEVYGEKLYSILDISDLLIDTLVDITGSSNNSPIPLLWSTNHYSVNIDSTDSTHLYLTCPPSSTIAVGSKFIITIKYTKTTDTPDTFDPAMLENVIVDRTYTGEITYESYYNIGERVIGRWIDGKPIYRCIRKFDTPLSSNWFDKYQININSENNNQVINFLDNCDTPIHGIAIGYTITDNIRHKLSTNISVRVENTNLLYLTCVANINVFYCEYLCIDYTKTTDAENSFVPSLINNEEETVDIPAAIAADTIILNTYDSETEEQTEP